MNQDPFAKREAEKYHNPIPSREYILSIFNKIGTPIRFNQLKKELMLSGEQNESALRKRLRAMVRDGQLDRINKDYCLKNFKTQITDWSPSEVSPQIKKIAGRLLQINGFNYVAPFITKDLQQDILIPAGNEGDAKIGDGVIVDVNMPLLKWADPIGKIVKTLGAANNRNVFTNMAIASLDIPHNWSAEVKQQISEIKQPDSANIIQSRVDLRNLNFVTIDGEDAKDFDDAVFCKTNKQGGWTLYVAIADVSYYVTQDSSLDEHALLRGNSLYFPGKVIPMLPEMLSNNLCSLKPNVDRLCMLCEMHISKSGKIRNYSFYEGIICSKARLTYNQVSDFLQNNKNTKDINQSILQDLLELQELFVILQQQRQERGAIEFDAAESKMIFNKKGEIIDIKPIKRNIAHKIIEECMLCANVATARFLEKNKLLSIYRVHEGPTSTKLLDLRAFLKSVGLSLDGHDIPTAKDYSKLLQGISHRKDADVIQMILLRSMCQAMYSYENIGHFGLAYPAYTHFTSPIRRYSDLLVHRHIKAVLHNREDLLSLTADQIKKIADHCSMTERRADDATREVIKACKCQYISKYIGSKFYGIVSGVTKFGLFVEIKDIYVDGLLHINSLGKDYFIYDPIGHKLVGEKSGLVYSLGMELSIIVSRVDLDRRRIDFVLDIEHKKKSTKKKSKAKQSATKKPVKLNKKSSHKVKSNNKAKKIKK